MPTFALLCSGGPGNIAPFLSKKDPFSKTLNGLAKSTLHAEIVQGDCTRLRKSDPSSPRLV